MYDSGEVLIFTNVLIRFTILASGGLYGLRIKSLVAVMQFQSQAFMRKSRLSHRSRQNMSEMLQYGHMECD